MIIRNLIPYPDMSDGWVGGEASAEQVFVGHLSRKLVGAAGSPEITTNTTALIALSPSHIYYCRFYTYQPESVGAFDVYWPVAEPSLGWSIPVGPPGQWNPHSVLNGRGMFAAGSHPLRLDFNNSFAVGTTYFDGAMLIDLTADFGAGREPGQSWCDDNIPFFSGQYFIDPQKILIPVILGATLTPNPAGLGAPVLVSVLAQEMHGAFTPQIWQSGEIQSGEM